MNDFSDKLRGTNTDPFTEVDKIAIVERAKGNLLNSFLIGFATSCKSNNAFNEAVRKTGLTESQVNNALNFSDDLDFERIVLIAAAIGYDIDFDFLDFALPKEYH